MSDIKLLELVAKKRKELESMVDGFSGDATNWKLANNVMNGFMTFEEAKKYFKEDEKDA